MQELNQILKKCSNGDSQAQRALYEQYRAQWYMISLRYSSNSVEADDILQEGLIRIYNDLHQFDPKKGAFSTWSGRVIVNAALRFIKKNQWQNTFNDLGEAHHIKSDFEGIYASISRKEITALIQQLPIGYRIVFNLYAIEGYSHKEISEQLGIAEGTSKSQLSKARNYLRQKFESQLKATNHE